MSLLLVATNDPCEFDVTLRLYLLGLSLLVANDHVHDEGRVARCLGPGGTHDAQKGVIVLKDLAGVDEADLKRRVRV